MINLFNLGRKTVVHIIIKFDLLKPNNNINNNDNNDKNKNNNNNYMSSKNKIQK